MEAMRESWTDGRLNELSRRIDARFEQIDRRFEEVDRRFEQIDWRFEQIDQRFDRAEAELAGLRTEMNARFDAMHRTMVQFSGGMLAAFAAAMVSLVATQL